MHINQYAAKGFSIKRVTSDGEASVRAVRSDVEALGVELNILGHGSHTPHAEAAIRHIKNIKIGSCIDCIRRAHSKHGSKSQFCWTLTSTYRIYGKNPQLCKRCSTCVWYSWLSATSTRATEQYCSSSWRLLHLAWDNP